MPNLNILSGIVATEEASFEQSLPVNLEAIGLENGIANGQLRLAAGARRISTGPGIDRGATVWNGTHYRVSGSKVASVTSDGVVTIIGDVGAGGPVTFARGFDRFAVASAGNLFYCDGKTLTQVTDSNLGACLDVAWLNGQFFTTDGTDVLAADINDPTSFTAVRYGSAESDPDPVYGILPLRDELYVFGASTIEVQSYTGGSNFPLTVNQGATVQKGCCGTYAKCRYSQTFAFIGSGHNEQPGVFMVDGASAVKLSTRAVDRMLAKVADLTQVELEARVYDNEERLFVHLPDRSLVYYFAATQAAQDKVWTVMQSGREGRTYRPRHATLVGTQFWVGDTDSAAIGVLDQTIGSHFDEPVSWSFSTELLWNKGRGAILHGLELVGLYGRGVVQSASAFMSYTMDGETWSIPRRSRLPKRGDRRSRMTWSPNKLMRNYMGLRFSGDSNSLIGIATVVVPDGSDGVEALAA